MKRVTVLHELNQLEMGGAERVVLNIAANDKVREHVVLAWRDGPFRAEFERAGVRVLLAPEAVGTMDIDVFHVHTGGHPSILAARGDGACPVVETIHAPVKSAVLAPLVRVRVACGGAVAAENPGSRVVYNGVDFGRLAPVASREEARARLRLRHDEFCVGWLGRLVPGKGLEAWIAAVSDARRKDARVVGRIVGPEVPDFPRYVRDLMDRLPRVGNGIMFEGPSNPGLVMPGFDTFMCLSAVEAHPLTRIEAMHLRCPMIVLGNRVGREFSENGIHAYTLDPAGAVIARASAAVLWKQTAGRDEAALDRAAAFAGTFSVERMVAGYDAVYREVLEEGAGAA